VSTAHQMLPVVERLDRAGVLALAPEWDRLLAASSDPAPLLAWPWVTAWLDTLGSDADLQVVTARDPSDGRLIGLAPLTVSPLRRNGVRYQALRFIATGPLGGRHLDLIVERDRAASIVHVLWEAATRERRWDILDLVGLDADGALPGLLYRRRTDAAAVDTVVRYQLDLTNAAERLTTTPGRRVRLVTSPQELDPFMSRMVSMVEAKDHRDRHRASFAHPSVLAFHREAARRLLDAGRLRMWRLDDGRETLAGLFAVRFGDVVAVHVAATDSRERSRDLLADLISHAALAAADEGALRFLLPPGAGHPSVPAEARRDVNIRRPVGPWGRILWTGYRVRSGLLGGRRDAPSSGSAGITGSP
jgi:hypothetical protein